jgi:hypothetical protein
MTLMARQDQAADLLRQGLPPSEIARQVGTSPALIMRYLCLKIGEGELRRSDIAFSLPHEVRTAIEQAIEKTGSTSVGAVTRELRAQGLNADRGDIGVYIHYRRTRVVLGDMYELVRSVEVRLHDFIKQAFIAEFGEEQWWRGGVPDNIRAECAALLEKDPEPAEELYRYTHLINLREILDKRWSVLGKYLPKSLLNQKKDLLDRLLRLNRIRNAVMHPVRNTVIAEDDFEFVRDFEKQFVELRVELSAGSLADGVPMTEVEEQPLESPGELVSALKPVADRRPVPETAATAEQAGEAQNPERVA